MSGVRGKRERGREGGGCEGGDLHREEREREREQGYGGGGGGGVGKV